MFNMEPKDRTIPQCSLDSDSTPHYGSSKSLSSVTPREEEKEKPVITTRRASIVMAVLCFVNLLYYMERNVVAGVLPNIQTYFGIGDSLGALIQSVFVVGIVISAPVFGYLGDRFNRKYILIASMGVWLVIAVGSSFVTKSLFWLFVLLRAIAGIGEGHYATIAPTIIGDLFIGKKRSFMLCIFYMFIPIGSGLGNLTGAGVAALTGDWHWGLRITPILGAVGLILLVFLCPNPPRGAAETHGEGVTGESTYLEDLKYLLINKSYVWSSLGVTALTFVYGAVSFWTPTFLSRARVSQGLQPPCVREPCNHIDSYIFGAVTVVTGILGTCLGSGFSSWFRGKVPNVDPLICAVGMLLSVPCLFISIFVASASLPATYVFIFFGQLCITVNIAVMADILLYVVIPTRRSTAEALQMSVCHLLGDAVSPYIVGAISDAIRKSKPATPEQSFQSLKYSLLVCPFVSLLGGLFHLMSSCYVTEDWKAATVTPLVEGDLTAQQDPSPSEPPIELRNKEIE